MNLNNLRMKDIVITDHALARAKERMKFNVDSESLEYRVKLKEIIQKSRFRDFDGNKYFYELIYDNSKYDVIAIWRNGEFIVNTIIRKGR
ncbi:MAG: hypothetical protein ACRC42_00180 [Mycoplasma sp.]